MTSLFAGCLPYFKLGQISGFLPFTLELAEDEVQSRTGEKNSSGKERYKVGKNKKLVIYSIILMTTIVSATLYIVVDSAKASLYRIRYSPLDKVSAGIEDWVAVVHTTVGAGAVMPMCFTAFFMWTPLAKLFASIMNTSPGRDKSPGHKNITKLLLGGDIVADTAMMMLFLACSQALFVRISSNPVYIFSRVAIGILSSWIFWAGDIIFLSLNLVARKALKRLVNENLSARFEEPQEALAHLDNVMAIHAELCGIIRRIANCFAFWIMFTCVLVFLTVLLGVFLLIALANHPEINMATMAMLYIPTTAMPTARLFLLSRSASLVQREVCRFSDVIFALLNSGDEFDGINLLILILRRELLDALWPCSPKRRALPRLTRWNWILRSVSFFFLEK